MISYAAFPKIKKHLIVFMGATASGKSEIAAKLAQERGLEVFSADARQLYKELKKGTAPPTERLQQCVRHHFVGTASVTRPLSAGKYATICRVELKKYFRKQDCAILVGGSWLYIKAVCEGLADIPDISPAIRAKWRSKVQSRQLSVLQNFVAQHDPLYYAGTDKNNPVRLARAAEIIEHSGKTYSSFLKKSTYTPPFQTHYVILFLPRKEHYARIQDRCHQMLRYGLLEEVRILYQSDITPPATIGYREFFDYFSGKYTKEESIERFIQHSKQYAKRQLTALRKVRNAQWFMAHDYKALRQYIYAKLAWKKF